MRRSFLTRAATLLLASSTLVASAINDIIRFEGTEWDDDNWIVRSNLLEQGRFQNRMSLANGYLGISLAAVGPFFEVDVPVPGDSFQGWPLFTKRQTFATIAGFYDNQGPAAGSNYPWLNQYGGESVLSGIPHWAGLVVEANGVLLNASVNPEDISHFYTSLDIASGLLSWEYTWKPGGGDPIKIQYSMFVHKLYVNQAAINLKLSALHDVNITVYDMIDGDCAVRSDFVDKRFETGLPTIWTAVSPLGVSNVTAYIYSTLTGNEFVDMESRAEVLEGDFGGRNTSSIAQTINVSLSARKTAEVSKFIGAASSDAFMNPQGIARAASITGATLGFAALLRSHIEEWASILTRDSVDRFYDPDGNLPRDSRTQELQILSVTNPFYILQNTVGPNAIAAAGYNSRLNTYSIPVCGLGSDCYGGLVFWDAETWMGLGLQISHPEHIQNIVNYRVEKYPQAKENVKMAFSSSKNQTGRFTGGAVYPWTSARYGNCTGTGPCFDYQYHINGDISMAFLNQYAVNGDFKKFKENFLPIMNDIAYFYGEVLSLNESSGHYEVWNATDPDEYANNVNNVGYTTALIQRILIETNELNRMFGLPPNETWEAIQNQMQLPVNEDVGIIMEYDSMNGSIVVKQADVVLLDDVLHYENPYSLTNLDYYANKQSPDGPGMTYAAFSIVANEISPSGCSSFTYGTYTSQPYVRAPWFQFSEQQLDSPHLNGGTHPAFPFLTGMGGANRIGVFGWLGLRLFVDRLDINPSLPPQIKYLNYRTFYWQGYGIDAYSNATHTTIMRIPDRILPTANKNYTNKPIPVTLGARKKKFWLGTEPLVLTNRMVGQTATITGNILQCKKLVPGDYHYMPGQFPIAAIDGAASTKWQPGDSTHVNYISVDLGSDEFYPVNKVMFDWGNQPPKYFEVLFTNVSIPPFGEDADIRNVTSGYTDISEPYDPSTIYVIQPVKGNQTNITLDEVVWSGRYAHLGISGNLQNGSKHVGGLVAEWSIIREI